MTKRILIACIAGLFAAAATAQTPAPAPATTPDPAAAPTTKAEANKAKQEMVKGTTEKAATQYSTAPNRGSKPTSEAKKMTKEEKKAAAASIAGPERGGFQESAAAGKKSASVDKSAPKPPQPNMNDPKAQEYLQKQGR